MEIVDLHQQDASVREQAASVLLAGFAEIAPHWLASMEAARLEVQECLDPSYLAYAALHGGVLAGWVGARPEYDGHVWEVHPLVVHPDCRRRGVGRALMEHLQTEARRAGGMTLWLGSDDHTGLTSAAGTWLYGDIWRHLRDLEDRGGHPLTFYRRLGFEAAGLLPDANGRGQPDIFFAKSLISQ